jgi:phytoene desaturase
MGGAAALGRAMADVIEEQGGVLQFNTTVDEILLSEGRASGVKLDDGTEIPAAVVVSNADAGFTYGNLLRNAPKKRWSNAKIEKARWSMGLYVWYFGTKDTRGKWADVGHHTILNGPRYEGLCKDIFIKGHLAEDMSVYLHRPSVNDPSAAPEGCDAWYALSPVPHLHHDDPVDWSKERDIYKAKLAKVLDQHMPGFEDHIEVEEIFTPFDFRDRYLAPYGSGFSIEPRILQSAWFRPHNLSDIPGLYLVGAGSHPGAGLPGVVTSAEVIDQLIPEVAHVR